MDCLRPGRRLGARAVAQPTGPASSTRAPARSGRRPWRRPGLPARILPEERTAGSPAGYLRHDGVVSCAAGAVLTVAGHDHPVAAVGVGAVEADVLFNSSGTADVLARSIPGTLPQAERQQVVTAGWSLGGTCWRTPACSWPGSAAGCCCGACWRPWGQSPSLCRSAPIAASLSVGDLPACLSVSGDGRTQDDVVLRVQDGASPATIWTAAVRYTADQARLLLTAIEKVAGPHRRAVAAGGWTQMASVRVAKAAAIDALSFSPVVQPGVTGAAMLAAYALASPDRQAETSPAETSPASSGKE